MLAPLLIVSLILGNDSVQGESKIASVEERDAPRVKFFGGLGGTYSHAIGGGLPALGGRLQMGRMFSDRFGVSALIDISTQIAFSTILGGATFTWVAKDWLALSGGLALGYFGATASYVPPYVAQLLVVPLLAEVSISHRTPSEVMRKGVVVGLMIAPGISRVEGQIGGAIVVGLSLGYAVW